MSNVFLGQPSDYIKNWFVETFISEDAYTILTLNNGSTRKIFINGPATWKNIELKTSQYDYNNTLTYCQLGTNVTEISDYAFNYCHALTSVSIPNSVTSIGNGAFGACYSLTSINIPSSVTSIGYYAFGNCDSLSSVDIPNSVTSIGSNAFTECDYLSSINIPISVTLIEYGTFKGCSSLTSISIPNSVSSIKDYAFADCNSLTSITIKPLKTLGYGALSANENLLSVIGTLFPYNGLKVNNIEYGAFYDCKSLKSLYIDADSISSIGADAFYGCSSLTSINFVTGQGATLAKIQSMPNYPFGADPSIIKLIRGEPT